MAITVCVDTGICGANWQPFGTLLHHPQAPDPTGPMYFDSFSWDAPDANIGYFLLGQGAYLNDPRSPHAALPFWGNPDGSAVPSFYFERQGSSVEARFLEDSGLWAPFNSLGWYDIDSADFGWIFQANGSPPAFTTFTFTPSQRYGLFFVPNSLVFNPAESYYTDSTRNGIAAEDIAYAAAHGIVLGPELFQHFAVFRDSNHNVYVGVNDRSHQVSDSDYNDMIFQLIDVPEPRSGVLILLGFLGLLALAKRTAEPVRADRWMLSKFR